MQNIPATFQLNLLMQQPIQTFFLIKNVAIFIFPGGDNNNFLPSFFPSSWTSVFPTYTNDT